MNNYTDHSITIDNLDIGVSAAGTEAYLENLKASLLTEVSTKIDDVEAITSALNSAWQGESRDKFDARFEKMREDIKSDLEAEYNDLAARLSELTNSYLHQDSNMILD
jgi:uncharacterized protein YukE